MKRFIVFLGLSGIMMMLCCCNDTKEKAVPSNNASAYTIKEENGNYYIHFDESASYSAGVSDMQTQIGEHIPKFSSVSELKTTIEIGNFRPEDLAYLQKRSKQGIVALGNPDNLYDVTLPNSVSTTAVYWYINSYTVDTDWGNNEYEYALIRVYLDKALYTEQFEQFCNSRGAADTIISEKNISDRNALELIYTNSLGKFKLLVYRLSAESKEIYVDELYCLETYEADFHWTVSDAVPFMVCTMCDEGVVQWYSHFTGFEERPSVEWLKSFGIKEITD